MTSINALKGRCIFIIDSKPPDPNLLLMSVALICNGVLAVCEVFYELKCFSYESGYSVLVAEHLKECQYLVLQ